MCVGDRIQAHFVTMDTIFLTAEELHTLTGFILKNKQIEQLRIMGIAFRVNGCGKPVVTRSAVEGGEEQKQEKQTWHPIVLQQAV